MDGEELYGKEIPFAYWAYDHLKLYIEVETS